MVITEYPLYYYKTVKICYTYVLFKKYLSLEGEMMKILSRSLMFTYVTFIFGGCTGHTMQDYADKHFNNKEEVKTIEVKKEEPVSPTKNEALSKISPLNQDKKDGAIQKSLDNWLTTVWTPSVDKNETIKKVDENQSRNFTLQEYVDKAVEYSKNKPDSNETSMKDKMDKLPVIGK